MLPEIEGEKTHRGLPRSFPRTRPDLDAGYSLRDRTLRALDVCLRSLLAQHKEVMPSHFTQYFFNLTNLQCRVPSARGFLLGELRSR